MKSGPKVTIFPDRKQLSEGLSGHLAHLAAKACLAHGRFYVALSGGSLLEIIAPALCSNPLRDRIDWSTWYVFWADERWVPLSSPDSNYGVAKSLLFNNLPIPSGQIYALDNSHSPDETARAYESALEKIFQVESKQIPRFDLILLGVGEDGHTASLFPGHPALNETRHWVVPILNAPKPPPVRITMTLPLINHACNVIFVATGPAKTNIISKVLNSKKKQPEFPVQMVNPSNGQLHWFIDRAAAERESIHHGSLNKKTVIGREVTMAQKTSIDQLCINTIRTLAMDAVQAADSGHPGTPMAMAPVAYTLWQRFLRFDPNDPIWPNRDRFVLSIGHASMLLYALLHLTGVKAVNPMYEVLSEPSITLDDIRNFRRLDSRTPGHPEYRLTSGVEATTGPLGQGVAMSVGMAIAGRWMAAYFNRPGFNIIDFNVYALAGDGCMMEGITGEAASLAGHLKLSNLCWIYDNNKITIEGPTALAFNEDVAGRFTSYGWNVLRVGDANDLERLSGAFDTFLKTMDRPTLVMVDSHIAYGAPNKQDTAEAHGSPLGAEEIRMTKRNYGWPEDSQFHVPDGVTAHFTEGIGKRGTELRKVWLDRFETYKSRYPELAESLLSMQRRELPEGWDRNIPVFAPDAGGDAGRNASGKVLNAIAANVPWLMGGSADLAPSTKTLLTFDGAGDFSVDNSGGRNFHFGVREHAMAAIINGMSLCKIRPYGSSFLIFSDYARAAIRLGALMEIPVIHVFTHDSIGVGEDGPTHQPVEHLVSLRAIAHMIVLRPADANEVAEAWRVIMKLSHRPVALILSRQNLPTLDRNRYAPAAGVARGAYVLADIDDGLPEIILIGTGSEVSLCIETYEQLVAEGIRTRVVSMPSWELFDQQDRGYRDKVLPPEVTARISVEQASTLGWAKYVGFQGISIGMETFGASAPLKALQNKFGFTVEHLLQQARQLIR